MKGGGRAEGGRKDVLRNGQPIDEPPLDGRDPRGGREGRHESEDPTRSGSATAEETEGLSVYDARGGPFLDPPRERAIQDS